MTRFPGRIRGTTTLLLILFAGAACDTSSTLPGNDPELDGILEREVTLNGLRPLSAFILPDETDLAALPQDPQNPLTPEKVALGKLLFHETGLATNPLHPASAGTYSCATCHHADAGFQAGRQQAIADGGIGWGQRGEGRRPNPAYAARDLDVQPLRSPSALNSGYQRVIMWSGNLGANGVNAQFTGPWPEDSGESANYLGYDGLESQAIAGLRAHRMNRFEESPLATNSTYQALWQQVWPGQDIARERVGLTIAAYERTLVANHAPWQRWLRGDVGAMTDAEKRGAILYFGKANCSDCHTGPALSQMAFYSLGMPDMPGIDASGAGARGRGSFTGRESDDFTFKVPQLYNLADSPFYGHGGTFSSLEEVVEYYNMGIPAKGLPDGRVTQQFHPLQLTHDEVVDLVAFLRGALRDPDLDRYVPEILPSGNCFPANDPEARRDLGCD